MSARLLSGFVAMLFVVVASSNTAEANRRYKVNVKKYRSARKAKVVKSKRRDRRAGQKRSDAARLSLEVHGKHSFKGKVILKRGKFAKNASRLRPSRVESAEDRRKEANER